MTLGSNPDGSRQPVEEIMAGVHRWTEEWKAEHQGKPLDELVRIGLETRAETLALLATLTDDELALEDPGRAVGRRHRRRDHGGQRRPRPHALQVGRGRPA